MKLREFVFRAVATAPLMTALRVLFDLRLEGTRSIPALGPGILVPNHQGYLDPLFIETATARPVRYLMTSDFYDLPRARFLFRFFEAIRVNERGPSRDSFRKATEVLDAGGLIGLFPEGRLSRDGSFNRLRPGVAFLAAKTGAPVIPARIDGSIRVLPKGRVFPRQASVTIRFGRPMRFTDPRDPTAEEKILAQWNLLGQAPGYQSSGRSSLLTRRSPSSPHP